MQPTPTHPHTPMSDDAAVDVDALIDKAALLAAAMTLALSPESRDKVIELRADGWSLNLEFNMDPKGGSGIVLTMTSPDGCTRKAVSDLATEAPSEMH